MTLYKNRYRIESTRLKDYDYSRDGAYFITICTKNREHFFGEINNLKINTTQAEIAEECWFDLPYHYPNCRLDEFAVMPNHVHGIIIIDNSVYNPTDDGCEINGGDDTMSVETGFKPVSTMNGTKRHSLSEMIRAFKTFTARRINEIQNSKGQSFWQTRFYDRIIRNENELNRTRKYIIDNPRRWEKDRNNKKNIFM
jgi:REP element-mobilizing transposase RayT